MAQPDPPVVRYRSSRALVVQGDCRHGLENIFYNPPAALVTDGPYGFWKRITDATKKGVVDHEQDALWVADVWTWMREWLPPFRVIMAQSRGPAWFFCDWHYVGFYMRWARWTEWPLRAIVQSEQTELLLCFCDDEYPNAEMIGKRAIHPGYKQGNGKSVQALRTLIADVPAPGYIYDPFCGAGSTLEAALREDRAVIGWELEALADTAAARCRAVEEELPCQARTTA